MDAVRFLYDVDWLAGNFENCILDSVQTISPYGHPSVVPVIAIDHELELTGAQALASTPVVTYSSITPGDPNYPVPAISTVNLDAPPRTPTWSALGGLCALTTQMLDGLQWTTTAQRVQIRLLGFTAAGQGFVSGDGVHSDEVRNGALVRVQVDGRTVEVVDTWQHNPLVTLYLLDGQAHTVTIAHSGQHDRDIRPISTPTVYPAGGGVSVLHALSVTEAVGSLVRGTWRVLATAPDPLTGVGTYSLYLTPPGGTESLVRAGMQAGVIYDSIPGANLFVETDPPLDAGDGATLTTDVVQMGVQSLSFGWGDNRGAAIYTTPILDGVDPQTQWFLAEWVQNVGWGRVQLTTGDMDADGTIRWRTDAPLLVEPQTLVLGGTQEAPLGTPDISVGPQMGFAGLLAGLRGRFARLSWTVAPYATEVPYLRDATIYYWVPETDRAMVTKMPLGERITIGPTLCTLLGTLETFWAATRFAAQRLRDAGSIGGATDEYLLAYGSDLGMRPYLGESPANYRTRLVAASASGAHGGSLAYIAQQVGLLIFGATQPPVVQTSFGHHEAICAEVDGTRAVQVLWDRTFPPQTYAISMPVLPYPGFPSPVLTPDQIKSIVTRFVEEVLNPVCSVIDYNKTALQIKFPY